MGVYGGVLFLAFNVLILLAIHWYVSTEQNSAGNNLKKIKREKLVLLEASLFEMREPDRRKEARRWTPPSYGQES